MKRQNLLTYTVFFEPAPEGGYTATVPALPGCVTEGDTLEEAREMATDAIKCYCESLLEDGEPLPLDVELPEPVKEKLQVALGK